MFTTQKQFSSWLTRQLENDQRSLLEKLDTKNRKRLYKIYLSGSDLQGQYELTPVLLKLGETVHHLMTLARDLHLTGPDKKMFVMNNIIALSRLIDNGTSGKEDNIHKNVKGFEFLTDKPDSLQEEFIRPQVDQAIEETYQLSKQFENEIKINRVR